MERRGFLTIAYGTAYYIRMAKCMAKSIRLRNPGEIIAIVTDSSDVELRTLFDMCIPINHALGGGVSQKLHVFSYSPFDETVFIDSDCLVFQHTNNIWEYYGGAKDFGICANGECKNDEHHMSIIDIKHFLAALNIDSIPLFNSGLFYWKKSKTADHLYSCMLDIFDRRNELGLLRFKNSEVNDEPILAAAMRILDICPLPWNNGELMSTWLGKIKKGRAIDVLQSKSRYNKNGNWVEPMVIHFNVNCQTCFTYKREMWRLMLADFIPQRGALAYIPALIEMMPYYRSRICERIRGEEHA